MYLDNAATTKIHPEVIKAMNNVSFANYNAKYYESSIQTHAQINNVIKQLSKSFNTDEENIVFTSSASEANNYIIKGIYLKYPNAHYITSTIEHKSVLAVFEYLESIGANVSYVTPDINGIVTKDEVAKLIQNDTKMVSIMYVNNETGLINEVEEISNYLRQKDILFHSDIVQAYSKIKVNFDLFDYMSLSAHKFNGPKGIGVAIVKGETLVPLIHGSSQQNNNRAGTLANELIVGLGKAVELVEENFDQNYQKVQNDRIRLEKILKENLGDKLVINFENAIPHILSIRIKDQFNQTFLSENSNLIEASTGSSCSVTNPSYVLKQLKFSDDMIRETIRLSLNAHEDIDF